MPRLNDGDELLAAWRALDGVADASGWRTIPLTGGGPCPLRAGRAFPANQEALLVGFRGVKLPAPAHLPQGKGFAISAPESPMAYTDERIWVALSRQAAGRLDLFAMMACDIVATLRGSDGSDMPRLLAVFLTRIRAWQDFMRSDGDRLLGFEDMVGLFGELECLRQICALMPPAAALSAWKGPLGGLHDFTIGTGAIEVKATAAADAFPVWITSLDQLDDTGIAPLVLLAIRLIPDPSGLTLPAQVAAVRDLLATAPPLLQDFGSLLVRAGYLDACAAEYLARFRVADLRCLSIGPDFPRLIPSGVPSGILRARYEIDLDQIMCAPLTLSETLKDMGVI